MQEVLLENKTIAAGDTERLLPGMDVARWDRLHFHISGGTRSIPNVKVRILFGTPVGPVTLLTDSTVWFENGSSEQEFEFTTAATYSGTGFVMSVPVVAPRLYDVIVENLGSSAIDSAYVTVMTQEI